MAASSWRPPGEKHVLLPVLLREAPHPRHHGPTGPSTSRGPTLLVPSHKDSWAPLGHLENPGSSPPPAESPRPCEVTQVRGASVNRGHLLGAVLLSTTQTDLKPKELRRVKGPKKKNRILFVEFQKGNKNLATESGAREAERWGGGTQKCWGDRRIPHLDRGDTLCSSEHVPTLTRAVGTLTKGTSHGQLHD